VTKIWSTVCR